MVIVFAKGISASCITSVLSIGRCMRVKPFMILFDQQMDSPGEGGLEVELSGHEENLSYILVFQQNEWMRQNNKLEQEYWISFDRSFCSSHTIRTYQDLFL